MDKLRNNIEYNWYTTIFINHDDNLYCNEAMRFTWPVESFFEGHNGILLGRNTEIGGDCAIWVEKDIWCPIVRLDGKYYVFEFGMDALRNSLSEEYPSQEDWERYFKLKDYIVNNVSGFKTINNEE